jgi:hypothetical protein
MGPERLSQEQAALDALANQAFTWLVRSESFVTGEPARMTVEIFASHPDGVLAACRSLQAARWVMDYSEGRTHLLFGYPGLNSARVSFGLYDVADAVQARALLSGTLRRDPG